MGGPAGSAAAVAVLAAALTVTTPLVALATMTATAAANTPTYATLAVAPATGLAAAPACGAAGSLTATVTLTWTVSTTTRLTSQVVLRRVGTSGPFSAVATLSTTATTFADTGLLTATTYSYEIRSAVSAFVADTAPVTANTPGVCL